MAGPVDDLKQELTEFLDNYHPENELAFNNNAALKAKQLPTLRGVIATLRQKLQDGFGLGDWLTILDDARKQLYTNRVLTNELLITLTDLFSNYGAINIKAELSEWIAELNIEETDVYASIVKASIFCLSSVKEERPLTEWLFNINSWLQQLSFVKADDAGMRSFLEAKRRQYGFRLAMLHVEADDIQPPEQQSGQVSSSKRVAPHCRQVSTAISTRISSSLEHSEQVPSVSNKFPHMLQVSRSLVMTFFQIPLEEPK